MATVVILGTNEKFKSSKIGPYLKLELSKTVTIIIMKTLKKIYADFLVNRLKKMDRR